jgi:large subunit ribosomal protein L21
MYAVIRTGGKQYRVAPGDVVKIERPAGKSASEVEFDDVLAFSDGKSPVIRPTSAKVSGTVVSEGRGDKVLVFHFKRKKQYKKLQGHRQSYVEIRIGNIEVDGLSYGSESEAKG